MKTCGLSPKRTFLVIPYIIYVTLMSKVKVKWLFLWISERECTGIGGRNGETGRTVHGSSRETIAGKETKSFQKQRTEHKTDPKADNKVQDRQERKCLLCQRTGHIAHERCRRSECKSVKPPKPRQMAAGGVQKGSRKQPVDPPSTQEGSTDQAMCNWWTPQISGLMVSTSRDWSMW